MQGIPSEILQRPCRMLYMTPLALGDFLYQSGYLRRVCEAFPQLHLDIWFDDLRSRSKSWQTGRNKTLGEWLDRVAFVEHYYPIPADEDARRLAVREAREKEYDLVLYLTKSRVARYEKTARQITPGGFVAGVAASKDRFKRMLQRTQPDLLLPMESFSLEGGKHVSEFYAHFFGRLFPIETVDIHPQMDLPEEWRRQVASAFDGLRAAGEKFVLINSLSTNRSHDLSLDRVFALAQAMLQKNPALRFILCAPPHAIEEFEGACRQAPEGLRDRLVPFTARRHFFELPALIDYCDYCLSVDTSVVHFASALRRPLVTLMRSNNTQWRPLEAPTTSVVFAGGKSWVKDIPLDDILAACDRQGFFAR